MNESMKKRWDMLTTDEKQHLEDFIIHDDTAHVDELQKLGFAWKDLNDDHWYSSVEGFECYRAGIENRYNERS